MSARATYVRLLHQDGTALPLQARLCDTFFCRLRGLTFRRTLAADEGLLFVESAESRLATSIHMFFVFFSIGVVWLAADGTVVDAKLAKSFRPYYAPRTPARYYLEGTPDVLSWVRIGERLTIEPSG